MEEVPCVKVFQQGSISPFPSLFRWDLSPEEGGGEGEGEMGCRNSSPTLSNSRQAKMQWNEERAGPPQNLLLPEVPSVHPTPCAQCPKPLGVILNEKFPLRFLPSFPAKRPIQSMWNKKLLGFYNIPRLLPEAAISLSLMIVAALGEGEEETSVASYNIMQKKAIIPKTAKHEAILIITVRACFSRASAASAIKMKRKGIHYIPHLPLLLAHIIFWSVFSPPSQLFKYKYQ